MHLEGSCHCGAVHFSLDSAQPYPYQRCYCSICRKTQGGGGYAVNIGGDAGSLQVSGRESISVYHARMRQPDGSVEISSGERHFCRECGSALWVYSPEWPELVHPFASAIDTELPRPPQYTHLMLGSKAGWVEVQVAAGDRQFDGYPEESLAEWHERLRLTR
ncbi:GFA family protein [Pseudomonas sp. MYb185]|uniref:GFA family protein n=1 Tax=Pseudomonas sp. MYb185 TaxID=1848729 RepID=UPI000CFB0C74|nr:GFA family protein [Pseudomonas sp. MYb185]PRB82744.1 alanine acetyltransferase [Pseudomonas sp. MYb185]